MLEAIRTLVISMFSKKFLAFVSIAYVLYKEKRWTELVIALGTYSGIEVVDKKTETKPAPTPPEASVEVLV